MKYSKVKEFYKTAEFQIKNNLDNYIRIYVEYNVLLEQLKRLKNFSTALHPIDADGAINKKVCYCSHCGITVKDQKYCHQCGYKLIWIKGIK